MVAGLVIKLGLITLSNGVCPTDNWLNPLAKAFPTGPSFSPISKSTCANSSPSPIRASPIYISYPPILRITYNHDFLLKQTYFKKNFYLNLNHLKHYFLNFNRIIS